MVYCPDIGCGVNLHLKFSIRIVADFGTQTIQYTMKLKQAKKLDITEEAVRDLIRLKELKAVKVGKWRVKPEWLESFINSRSNL